VSTATIAYNNGNPRQECNNGIATEEKYFLCGPCRDVITRTSLGNLMWGVMGTILVRNLKV
jgi:hypothetical protein